MRRWLIPIGLVLLLSGCGGSGDDATSTATATVSVEPTTTSTVDTETTQDEVDFPPAGVPASAKEGTIREVTDGDTVVIKGIGSSRLIGVDTPEVYGGSECYGAKASAYTRRELPSGAQIYFDYDVDREDLYGRALVYLWTSDGDFFNSELARNGYAVPLTIAPDDRYAAEFRQDARAAKAADAGLWSPKTCDGNPDLALGPKSTSSSSSAGPDKDCDDFDSQREAQRFFEQHGGPKQDPDLLDADGNGKACESL